MKPLRIGFFAENCLPFHANSLSERPLGGTETGIIRLTEQLMLKGHQIEVFTRFDHQNNHTDSNNSNGSITYKSPSEIHSSDLFDALVLVKDYKPARFKLPAKKVLFLTGDGPEQFINFGFGDLRIVNAVDALLTVSNWQADALCEASGFPRNKAYFIGNGVHLPFFENQTAKNPKKLFYASSPNRGLLFAYQAFTMLQQIDKEVTFDVFAGFDVYNDNNPFSGPLLDQFNQLKNLISQNPAISLKGNLTQEELAKQISTCSILFYPNQFVETSCIVAMEAQAAGCPVIATDSGGLPETVGDRGILIKGIPGTRDYMVEFAQKTSDLLKDKAELDKLSHKARSYAFSHFGWDKVAKRFEDVIKKI